MGDALPRRLSVSVSLAGSSFAPVLPVHEARGEEGRRRAASRASATQEGWELSPLQTSRDSEESSGSEEEIGEDQELLEGEQQMTKYKKAKSRSPNPRTLARSVRQDRPGSESSASGVSPVTNGHLPEMNGSFRERVGKHPSIDVDGSSERRTARLMGRSSFSLDHAPPLSPTLDKDGEGAKGFFELSEKDRRNFLLLVLLYFLQGIPMGLAGGSVPFLLKSHLSYSQIGVYSLAIYPYSLKLLWSPIVDAVWSSRIGRRKSWILPIQTMSGFGMLWLGSRALQMMEKAGEDNGSGVWGFTGWWFSLVFMCATQDIAVDGMSAVISGLTNISC